MTKRTRPAAATPSARAARSSTVLWASAAGVLILAASLAAWFFQRAPAAPPAALAPPPTVATYVGGGECMACHAAQYEAWTSSQHAHAMQHADAQTVRGDFNDAKFALHGVTSTFFRRDGRYFVRTDGPDGRLADFEIRYTFGIEPLQQYLVEFPDGRLQ